MSSSSVSSSSSFSSDSFFPEDSDHDEAQQLQQQQHQQQQQQNDKGQQNAPKSTFPPPSIKDVVCHYQVLGIESSADTSIIKKAYRRLALQYHPDKQIAAVQDDATTTTTTTTAAAASLMAHENFRRLQEAYECLMDPSERRWYDDHREAIVRGWTSRSTRSGDHHHHHTSMDLDDIVVDVMPYMNSMCYRGYAHPSQDLNSFYFVYANVFERIVQGELRGSSSSTTTFQLPTHFGHADTDWDQVSAFYMAWLSFSTQLSFSWVDLYDTVHDADQRRIRRAMQDANQKVRKVAKKSRNEDVLALVRHVQRRDPRVQNYQKQQVTAQKERQATIQAKAQERKQQAKIARQLWQQQAEQDIAAQEEQDRLAGRIRLADLQDDGDDDDYEYNVGKGKKKKKKKSKKKRSDNNNNNNKGAINDEDDEIHQVDDTHASAGMPIRADASNQDNDITNKAIGNDNQGHNGVQSLRQPVAGMDKTLDDVDPSSLSFKVEISDDKDTTEVDDLESDENGNDDDDDEINVWHCECCRKDFKSVGQMENHMKSKKHKETYKRYQKKFEQEILQGMLDNME